MTVAPSGAAGPDRRGRPAAAGAPAPSGLAAVRALALSGRAAVRTLAPSGLAVAAALAVACVPVARPALAADAVRAAPSAAAPPSRAAPPAPPPELRPCPSLPSVHAGAADPRDAETACDGAAAAVRFFDARGLRTFDRIELELRADLPPAAGPRAVGCYLPDERRVVIQDGATFRRQRTWLGVRIEPGMHRAVAAHEVAHALAACNFAAPRPPVHAQEYVAYVVTLATMAPALRERVLRANPGDGFATVSTIGELLYAFDSQRFGVESYRHWAKPEHGDAFLRRVLAGEALAD